MTEALQLPRTVKRQTGGANRGCGCARLLLFAVIVLGCLLPVGLMYLYVEDFVIPTANRRVNPVDSSWMPLAQDVAVQGDGVTLRGWYVSPENGIVIIVLHGYGGDRSGMRFHADVLVGAGYGVLLMDSRGSGVSGGERRSYGWEDAADVPGMVTFLTEQGVERIGIYGHSIGGQIAIRGARLSPEITAILADGPSVSQARDLLPLANVEDALFYIPTSIVDLYMAYRLDMPVPAPVREDIAALDDRPVLLIGGAATRVEKDRMQSYADAGGDNVDYWLVEGAGHGQTWVVAPEAYADRMLTFLNSAFGNAPDSATD